MSKNALDTTMAWGDILTLLATELVRTHITGPCWLTLQD